MNIPAFLTERLTAQYGEETARRIAAGFEAGRKTTLRVNRLKAEPAQIAAALADAGISARRVSWSEDALVLEGAGAVSYTHLDVYKRQGSSWSAVTYPAGALMRLGRRLTTVAQVCSTVAGLMTRNAVSGSPEITQSHRSPSSGP